MMDVDKTGLDSLESRLNALDAALIGLGRIMVAVSGGLDSRFLVARCLHLGLDVEGVHVLGPHVDEAETDRALGWLKTQAVIHALTRVDVLEREEVRTNSPERCYVCKLLMFKAARVCCLGRRLVDGTQASDLGLHRPGRRALAELGVVSPLAEAGLSKEDVRQAARDMGLAWSEEPARPCLLTRFAYGLSADEATLASLGRAEGLLSSLGLRDFRLRLTHEGSVLQVAQAERDRLKGVSEAALRAPELAPFLPLSIRFDETVSGFFDRQS